MCMHKHISTHVKSYPFCNQGINKSHIWDITTAIQLLLETKEHILDNTIQLSWLVHIPSQKNKALLKSRAYYPLVSLRFLGGDVRGGEVGWRAMKLQPALRNQKNKSSKISPKRLEEEWTPKPRHRYRVRRISSCSSQWLHGRNNTGWCLVTNDRHVEEWILSINTSGMGFRIFSK